MTDEQNVKAQWPDAVCSRLVSPWKWLTLLEFSIAAHNQVLGKGATEGDAWADAASRLGAAPESHKESTK